MDLSQSNALKVEDGLFGELESHQEKICQLYTSGTNLELEYDGILDHASSCRVRIVITYECNYD